MVQSRSSHSSAFNSKLNQQKAQPLSVLSKTRAPLRDLHANVEDPGRKPNEGKAALKGNDSLKKPLRVVDNIQSKKIAPRNDLPYLQKSKAQEKVVSGAVGQRTDRQRTAARPKASDQRHFKVYDDAIEEQVAPMRSSKPTGDVTVSKVRRCLLNQEHAATDGQDAVSGRDKLEIAQPTKELVGPVKVSPLPTRKSDAKANERSPNVDYCAEKEPISLVPTISSPVIPSAPVTATPAAATAVTPVAKYVPSRGPSVSPPSPSCADFIPSVAEGAGTEAKWSTMPKSDDFQGAQLLHPFSSDSKRTSFEPTKADDGLPCALARCSIAPKPAEMRPVLGRKIVGRNESPPLANLTIPMRTQFPHRSTITKYAGFEHLTEYFPDRAEEIQRFYRQKEFRRRKAIESMMIQNTRQTQQKVAKAVSFADRYREPNERNGFVGQPVDKYCCSGNKYGAVGQTKNGYAPGVCARQLGPKQAVKQSISYETEELLRMNFLVCGNLCHSKAQARNKKCVRSNATQGTAIGTRR